MMRATRPQAVVSTLIACTLITFNAFAESEEVSNLLKEAENHYQNREQKDELLNAIANYQKALQLEPSNFEAAWRLAKAYWYEGNFQSTDKTPVFEKGIESAKKAIRNNPQSCAGHFWLGVNYAVLAEVSSGFKALGLVDDIKQELNRAMEIDKNCECAGPSRALGKLHSKLPWFKGGSKKRAIAYLNQSLKLCPSDTQSRIFLAEIYQDQGEQTKAIALLREVEAMEAPTEWIPETKANKTVAEKMLQKLEKPNHGKD